MSKQLTKCNFCSYKTATGCTVTPNSHYCKKAAEEYYQHIRSGQPVKQAKSLRPWDKR
jgi:hypothetical protein